MVAKKLQPLIAAGAAARSGERRDVRQRMVEQRRVREAVANLLLQRAGITAAALGAAAPRFGRRSFGGSFGRLAGIGRGFPPLHLTAHLYRTIVPKRFQRTVHGQRQNSSARSPSASEKKMICALPMKFSNGT